MQRLNRATNRSRPLSLRTRLVSRESPRPEGGPTSCTEALERRMLLSGIPPVVEVNPAQVTYSAPANLTTFRDELYFTGRTGAGASALFRTDGAAVTVLANVAATQLTPV